MSKEDCHLPIQTYLIYLKVSPHSMYVCIYILIILCRTHFLFTLYTIYAYIPPQSQGQNNLKPLCPIYIHIFCRSFGQHMMFMYT